MPATRTDRFSARRPAPGLGIRSRLALLIAAFAAAFGIALFLLDRHEARRTTLVLEDHLRDARGLVERLLEETGGLQSAFTKDYAEWDDTAKFIEHPQDDNWRVVNLEQPLSTFGIAGDYLFDVTMRQVACSRTDDSVAHDAPIDARRLPELFPGPDQRHFFAGRSDSLFEVHGIPVHHRDAQNEPLGFVGWLVSVRRIDEDALLKLCHLSGLHASLLEPLVHGVRPDVIAAGVGTFGFSRVLTDADGRAVAELRFTGERPLVALAASASARLLLIGALLAFSLLVVLSVSLFRQVVQPMRSMANALRSDSAEPLAAMVERRDEFGAIARLTAQFFAQKRALVDEVEVRRRVEGELQHARDEALAATRAKSAFLASMSHEIRTPLNGVIGMAAVLAEQPLTEDQQVCARTIKDSAEALLSIVNDVLDFSRIEAGRMDLEQVEFDAGALIEDIADLFAARASERGVLVQADVARDLPARLIGDPCRVRQIIQNLVGNAVKFTESGSVVIRASLVKRTPLTADVAISVCDTGIGIPHDRQAAIFESFTQAESGTVRRFGGTGLGLTISRRLARLMEGEIRVESEPGRGSTFTFTTTLPVPMAASPARAAAFPRSTVVLVEEADDAVAEVIVARIAELGATVVRTRTPASTTERVEDATLARVDVVIAPHAPPAPRDAAARAPAFVQLRALRDPIDPNEAPMSARLRRPVRRAALAAALGNALGLEMTGAPVETTRTRARPLAGVRVLLVDDHPVNLRVGSRLIGGLGAEVTTADSGPRALERIRRETFDLVLLDCQMPEMDGFEVTRTIRAGGGAQSRIPIVALTADAQSETRRRCIEAGMNEHIAKPIVLDQLVATCRALDVVPPVDSPRA